MLTKPSIKRVQELSEEEHTDKLTLFSSLLPKLEKYIHQQAYMRSCNLPGEFLGIEDFEAIGRIQLWAAVVSWDPVKGSLESWSKRCIWTNMNVVISSQYQAKRIPHSVDTVAELQRPISLFSEGPEGLQLFESLPDTSVVDPMEGLLEDELYRLVQEKLLSCGERIAAAILRLSLFPDEELLLLCDLGKNKDSKRRIRITNRALSARLSVSTSRISLAKSVLRKMILELGADG